MAYELSAQHYLPRRTFRLGPRIYHRRDIFPRAVLRLTAFDDDFSSTTIVSSFFFCFLSFFLSSNLRFPCFFFFPRCRFVRVANNGSLISKYGNFRSRPSAFRLIGVESSRCWYQQVYVEFRVSFDYYYFLFLPVIFHFVSTF